MAWLGCGVGLLTVAMIACGDTDPAQPDGKGLDEGLAFSPDAGGDGDGDRDRDGPQPELDAGGDGDGAPAGPDGGTPDGGPTAMPDAGPAAEPKRVALPAGSREWEGVVNLVEPDLADELTAFLDGTVLPMHPLQQRGLVRAANRFLELYRDEYDFILVLSDGPINGPYAGRFQEVNNPARRGDGHEMEIQLADYRSQGALRGVMGVQHSPGYFGPFAHEIAHYWINHLDGSFGFSRGADRDHGVHWGYSSVNGHLGGFDRASLRCASPADAALDACDPEPSGRFRYVVDNFAPGAGASKRFAPLELYLMGFGAIGDVPAEILMLDNAAVDLDSYADADQDTVIVEADGMHELAFADIVALHGEVARLPEAERAFRAAFVVVSAEPVDDAALEEVAQFAAVFGGREPSSQLSSWSDLTGGLSTMETRLGERRLEAEPVPEPAPGIACEVLAQDCPRAELGCYGFSPPTCMLAGAGAVGDVCRREHDCAAGLSCMGASAAEGTCQAYCDIVDASSALACASVCPANYTRIVDSNAETLGAICSP